MDSLYVPLPDGERLLMVAMELVMALFGLLYAFPHVPSRLLESKSGPTTWFSVASHDALRSSLLMQLKNSPVMNACLKDPQSVPPLTLDILAGTVVAHRLWETLTISVSNQSLSIEPSLESGTFP